MTLAQMRLFLAEAVRQEQARAAAQIGLINMAVWGDPDEIKRRQREMAGD